jgi:hypothetical protein
MLARLVSCILAVGHNNGTPEVVTCRVVEVAVVAAVETAVETAEAVDYIDYIDYIEVVDRSFFLSREVVDNTGHCQSPRGPLYLYPYLARPFAHFIWVFDELVLVTRSPLTPEKRQSYSLGGSMYETREKWIHVFEAKRGVQV